MDIYEELLPLSTISFVKSTTVVVCYADIRGFTTFVQGSDSTVQNYVLDLLQGLYRAINIAFKEVLKNMSREEEFGKAILSAADPKILKRLGDGVMLVWEPPDSPDEHITAGFNLFVLDFIHLLQSNFYNEKQNLRGKHPHRENLIEPLHLGIGLSCGNAWRLSGINNNHIDYAGTPLNVAARLQSEARPFGLVCSFDLLPNLFLEKISLYKEGKIVAIMPKGIMSDIKVWKVEKQIINRRRSRILSSFGEVMNTMDPDNKSNSKQHFSLSVNDTKDLFEIREEWEERFAGHLAERVATKEVTQAMLESINPAKRDGFHEGIAKLSTVDKKEGIERSRFVDWAYNGTREVHSYAKNDSPEEVKKQHTEIFNAIKDGIPEEAKRLMRKHLNDNCVEGKTGIIKEAERIFKESLKTKKNPKKK